MIVVVFLSSLQPGHLESCRKPVRSPVVGAVNPEALMAKEGSQFPLLCLLPAHNSPKEVEMLHFFLSEAGPLVLVAHLYVVTGYISVLS